MQGNNRIHYIDQVKGIGILLILLGHVSYEYGPISTASSYFKIVVFYVISGLMASFGQKEINIKYKIKTLMYPYVFFSLPAFAVFLIFQIHEQDFGSVSRGVISVLTLRGISTLWFLPSLLAAIWIHSLCCSHKKVTILLLVSVPLISLAAPYVQDCYYSKNILAFGLSCFMHVAVKGLIAYWFFEVSYLCSDLLIRKIGKASFFLFPVCCGIAVFIGDTGIDLNMLNLGKNCFIYFLLGYVMSISLLALFKEVNVIMPGCEYIGRNSLFIMCTHNPIYITQVSSKLFRMIMGDRLESAIWYYVFCFLTSALTLAIDIILLNGWKRIKKKRNLDMLKYC